ncbi:MAG: tetratricopeptide repeat protein [Thermoanaerobaculia bacterium]
MLARLLCILLVSAVPPAAAARTPDVLTADEWRLALEERGVERPHLRSPIEPDEELRAAVAGIVASVSGTMASLRRLQAYLFDSREFAYDYYAGRTLNATETFVERRGNCVSFTNLFIAMARAIDIPVQAALARIPREIETIGDLVIVNSHVVAVVPYASGRMVFDFDQNRTAERIQYRIISDLELTAVYLNNLGAERLIADDPRGAISYFTDASRLAPDFAASHRNLGVAFQRTGDLAAAIDATLLSLYYEPRNISTRNNLLGLFAASTRAAPAEDAPAGGPRLGSLLRAGDQALSTGQPGNAWRFYRKALRIDENEPDVYVALARVLLFRGRLRGAVRNLRTAIHLDRGHPEARRLLRGLDRE